MPLRLSLAVPVLVLALAAACSGAPSPGGAATTAPAQTSPAAHGTPAVSGSGEVSFDQLFIDMMVPHHESAVAMAKLARERAEHPELKQLAGEIIAAQESEITLLRDWRKAWFGSAETPSMNAMPMLPGMAMEGHSMGGTMDMTEDVDALQTANPFDGAFIDAMTEHHEMAIRAARLALASAQRSELKQLAGAIVEAQEREVRQLKEWRSRWYPGS
jgi:uncharacterized protein (DUF305 family)